MKRVVLGTAANGVSEVSTISDPPAIFLFKNFEDIDDVAHDLVPQRLMSTLDFVAAKTCEVAELFGSATPIPTVEGDTAATVGDWKIESDPGGFKLRISTYGADVETGLHSTTTFDIDIVISGEMTLIAEDGTEVVLTEGDSVVIPGVVHGWRSGPNGCRVAFMMIGQE